MVKPVDEYCVRQLMESDGRADEYCVRRLMEPDGFAGRRSRRTFTTSQARASQKEYGEVCR